MTRRPLRILWAPKTRPKKAPGPDVSGTTMPTILVADASDRGCPSSLAGTACSRRHVTYPPFRPQKYNSLQNRPVNHHRPPPEDVVYHHASPAMIPSYGPPCHGLRQTAFEPRVPCRQLVPGVVLGTSCRRAEEKSPHSRYSPCQPPTALKSTIRCKTGDLAVFSEGPAAATLVSTAWER